jgi:hypothetical protein
MSRRLKQASWTHGNSVLAEGPNPLTVERLGFGGRVSPNSQRSTGWVHFAIPTPVIVDEVRLNIDSFLARFQTGSAGKIIRVDAYDGETQLISIAQDLSGSLQTKRWDVPSHPQVLWGLDLSLLCEFANTGGEAWVLFHAAGADLN